MSTPNFTSCRPPRPLHRHVAAAPIAHPWRNDRNSKGGAAEKTFVDVSSRGGVLNHPLTSDRTHARRPLARARIPRPNARQSGFSLAARREDAGTWRSVTVAPVELKTSWTKPRLRRCPVGGLNRSGCRGGRWTRRCDGHHRSDAGDRPVAGHFEIADLLAMPGIEDVALEIPTLRDLAEPLGARAVCRPAKPRGRPGRLQGGGISSCLQMARTVPSLISRWRGTLAILRCEGFDQMLWAAPSRSNTQP